MHNDEFAEVLSGQDLPSSSELGGLPVVLQRASEFAKNVYAERLAEVLMREGASAREAYLEFAMNVLGSNPYPLVVAAVAQKLSVSELSRDEARLAQGVLLTRARDRATPLAVEMASECLSGAFLLAAERKAPRSTFIAALEDFGPGDEALLVRRVALLAGLTWCWGGSEDVEESLRRLAKDAHAGEQAAFELGIIEIDRALCSQDKESLFARLSEAATWFEKAEHIDPEMLEATAFRATLGALMLFCDGEPAEKVEHFVKQACEAASERFYYLDRSSMREWLRPRLDVQTTWYELSCALQGLSQHMSERSWLRALPVLQQLANLRSTLLRLATDSGDALRATVTDRLASGFVAREGLCAHLQDWANDADIDDANLGHALALLAAVDRMRTDQGKAGPLVSEGGLASGDRPDDETLAHAGVLLTAQMAAPLSGQQEKCFAQITSALHSHDDYSGSVLRDVNVFIIFLIRFLSHCLDVGYEMGKTSFSFLFQHAGAKPLEQQLQEAMFTWLHLVAWGFKNHQVRREVPDVASGRADLAITTEAWTMYAELKREMTDASQAGLTKYLGQTSTYQLTGPRIGFLVVLDLCSQRDWTLSLQDNCWVESVQTAQDSSPRMVVVFRIPGMRPVPSDVVTPSSNTRAKRGDAKSKPKTMKPKATKPEATLGKVTSKRKATVSRA
ncbi:hypothetical protein WI77_15080 [Burkholderia ubonensis]|uniref:hypothetical protein n=1 Tax=Burkholderia ubonensis TaxID=101571 RepID=UPI00076D85BD|nr:hypothetical protein [Burkholderia ubonensis]KVC91081.1 hypothetical protein WI77_15080 [Burkholderia ubonensis]